MKVKYKYKTKPYKHQQDCLEKCWDKKIFALFMEMGTGKSKVLIDNMSILYEQDRINFAVVIAPKGVYRNWSEKEIPEHMPDRIKREVIVWKTKLSQADKEILVKMKEDPSYEPLVIFVINVEAFSSLRGKKVADWLTSNGYGSRGMITVDESTTIKNHKAKRTKTLINMSKYFQYKRILTGSPVANSPLDLYSQCEFLGEKILGYDSYYPFQARYAVMHRKNMGTISFNQVLGYRNIDELTRKIDDFSDRVLKKDCLDLPEKIYTSRSVSMNPDQIRMYEEIRKKSILMIDKDMVSANMVATQLLRLQQILSGHLRSDDGDLIKFPTRRLDALVEICEEASGKVCCIFLWRYFR